MAHCTNCGEAAPTPAPTSRQELLHITSRQTPHGVPEKPDKLWLLGPGRHELPIQLVHHQGALLEDEGHDWHWGNGQLYYHGAGGLSCLVVLTYDMGD